MHSVKTFRLLAGESGPLRQRVELWLDDLGLDNVVIRVAYSSVNYKDALASKELNAII